MKKITIMIAAALMIAGVSYAVLGENMLHPVLKNFGPVYDVPFAVDRPDGAINYKIVADVGLKNDKPEEIYPPLTHIARLYNLHVYGGVPQKNLDLAVVIWGESIPVITDNEAYKKKYGVDNPNLKIISEMKQAGVKFYGCGQSIKKFGVDPATVNPDITIALSRFTTVSTLQMKGYACFNF